ncbi:MAG: hypothetical protein COA95_09865 [Methylophaga sp.]|nr:MAG: hypothetical protein COA95_09865 [Methylophaga sp.]
MSEMSFELMLKQYFGEKAFHSAGSAYSNKYRNSWFKKLERKLSGDINDIDTSERHKSMLLSNVEALFASTKSKEPNWDVVFSALMLISRFLGYDYCKGSKLNTLTYYQTPSQYYTQVIFDGGDVMQDYYDSKNIISQRAAVAKELKESGLSAFRISQILSISEYKVKQLLKDF